MGLIDKLQQQGSQLSTLNGQTPNNIDQIVPLNPESLLGSILDLNGQTPTSYDQIGKLSPDTPQGLALFQNSTLDLNDGNGPTTKYLDNLPQ